DGVSGHRSLMSDGVASEANRSRGQKKEPPTARRFGELPEELLQPAHLRGEAKTIDRGAGGDECVAGCALPPRVTAALRTPPRFGIVRIRCECIPRAKSSKINSNKSLRCRLQRAPRRM